VGYIYGGTDFDATRPAHWAKPGPKPRTELPPFDPTLCGTMPGYRQHRLHGQKQCTKCNGAQSKYLSEWRAKSRRR
jgi:hypothetical protein